MSAPASTPLTDNEPSRGALTVVRDQNGAPPLPPVAPPTTSSGAPDAPAAAAPPAGLQLSSTPIATTALTLLATLLLGLVVQLVIISDLQHGRAQRVSYAQLRNQLAQGTAPVSALDNNGKPLPLGAPVALIEIPRLGVREVVGQGTTSSVLADGPGHRRDTVLPGQAGVSIIMGRQAAYGGPFGHIKNLQVGDRVKVTTGQGVQSFAVLDVRRAGDPAPPALGANESRLTLMTATGAAYVPSGVIRVDARLTSAVQPAGPVAMAPSALPTDEKVLHGEPGAWLPLVLWGQAFLIAAVGFVWARARWGRWQSWIVGTPVIAALAFAVANAFIRLLPNVM